MPKGSNKRSGGRQTTSWQQNVAASLRTMTKQADADSGILYQLGSAAVDTGLVLFKAGSFLVSSTSAFFSSAAQAEPVSQPPSKKVNPNPKAKLSAKQRFDTEQDSKYVDKILAQHQARIDSLEAQVKVLDGKDAMTKEEEQQRVALLDEMDNEKLQQVELMAENIREHARKRVDLFFLLMVAAFEKQMVMAFTIDKELPPLTPGGKPVRREPTIKQHGKGRKSQGTAGCHASLFPNPWAAKIVEKKSSGSMTFHVLNQVTQFFAAAPEPEDSSPKEKYTLGEYVPFLEGTHFEDSLNLVHELPKIVNEFDCKLEGTWQKSSANIRCRYILNRVFSGEIDPIEGLAQFGTLMDQFFGYIKYNWAKECDRKDNLCPKALDRVIDLQREGTFLAFQKSLEKNRTIINVNHKYVALMLGLDWTDYLTSFATKSWVHSKIRALQQEIYQNPSTLVSKP